MTNLIYLIDSNINLISQGSTDRNRLVQIRTEKIEKISDKFGPVSPARRSVDPCYQSNHDSKILENCYFSLETRKTKLSNVWQVILSIRWVIRGHSRWSEQVNWDHSIRLRVKMSEYCLFILDFFKLWVEKCEKNYLGPKLSRNGSKVSENWPESKNVGKVRTIRSFSYFPGILSDIFIL